MTLGLLNIGPFEVLLVVAVAVMLFGGDLPDAARKAGRLMARLRATASELGRAVYEDGDPRAELPPRRPSTPPPGEPRTEPPAAVRDGSGDAVEAQNDSADTGAVEGTRSDPDPPSPPAPPAAEG